MSDAVADPGWYEDPDGRGVLRWWDGAAWHDRVPAVEQRPLPHGTATTWSIWVIAVLPAVGTLLSLLTDPAGQVRASVRRSLATLNDPTAVPAVPATTPGQLVSWLVSLVLIAATVLLALHDQRTLRARGVVRPFPWGWAFLGPVYVIGRAVVARRRTGAGLAPMWTWVAIEVAALAVSFTVAGIAFADALATLRTAP